MADRLVRRGAFHYFVDDQTATDACSIAREWLIGTLNGVNFSNRVRIADA